MQKEDCIASGILSCLLCDLDLHCAQSIPSYRQHKNYKIPLPGLTPENGENCPKKGVKLLREYNFCNFSVIFPHFRGSDRGGAGGFLGPLRGKTTRKISVERVFRACGIEFPYRPRSPKSSNTRSSDPKVAFGVHGESDPKAT